MEGNIKNASKNITYSKTRKSFTMVPVQPSKINELQQAKKEADLLVLKKSADEPSWESIDPKSFPLHEDKETLEMKLYEKQISKKKHDIDENKLENINDLDNDESLNKNFQEKLGKMNLVFNSLPKPTIQNIPAKLKLIENSRMFEINSSDHIKKPKEKSSIENVINNHPYRHLMFAPYCTESTFKKHLLLTYRGLVYSKKCLKGPSESFIKSKQVNLVDSKGYYSILKLC